MKIQKINTGIIITKTAKQPSAKISGEGEVLMGAKK